MTFSPATVVTRHPDHVSADLQGEVLLMSISQGRYYGLNSVASRLWQLIEQPMAVEAVCQQLRAEFEVSEERCRNEVGEFLGKLLDRGLINCR